MRKIFKLVFLLIICLFIGCDYINFPDIPVLDKDVEVSFYYDGKVINSEKVKRGSMIESFDLDVPSDENYHYEIIGWYIDNQEDAIIFPYEVNEVTKFYPIINKTDRMYSYTIYDGDSIIKQSEGSYNDKIDYPHLDNKIINDSFSVFLGWKYENENGETLDIEYVENLNQNLIIRSNYTTDQVFTVIIDDLTISSVVNEGELINLKHGKPNKNEKVAWYLDPNYIDPLQSNIMPNGSLVIYGRYEEIDEIDTSILDIDYENISIVNSEYEFLLLFNALLLNKVDEKEVTLNFEYESVDDLFSYISSNINTLRNYTFNVKYSDNVFNISFDYKDIGGMTSSSTAYKQLSSYNVNLNTNLRPKDYDSFYINSVQKEYNVVDSESLFYALEHGYKPLIDESNVKLISLYEEMKNVLRNIISDDMNEFEKARAIYEWLIMNVTYDKEVLDLSFVNPDIVTKYNAFLLEGVFNDHKAVCDGISKAFVCLANIEGIKCVRVTGTSVESNVNHAWNKILIDGNWYIIDATSGGTIINNSIEVLTYEFFLVDSISFSKHYIDNNEYYLFIETNYDYDSYNNIYVKVNNSINIKSKEEAKVIITDFFTSQFDTFTFKLAYYEDDDFSKELSSIIKDCKLNVSFNYLYSGKIITLIKN